MEADEKRPEDTGPTEIKTTDPPAKENASPKSWRQDAEAESRPTPATAAPVAQAPSQPEPASVKKREAAEVSSSGAGRAGDAPAKGAEPPHAVPATLAGRSQTVPEPSMPPSVALVAATPILRGPEQARVYDEDLEVFTDAEAERRIRAKSRRSFLWGAAAILGTWKGLEWMGTRQFDQNIAWPFRRLLEVNENLSRDLFSSARLSPEFPKEAARMPRPNGAYGVAEEVDPDWELRLVGLADMSEATTPDTAEETTSEDEDTSTPSESAVKKGGAPAIPPDKKEAKRPAANASEESDSTPAYVEPAVVVSMKEIMALPRTEIVTELKCIEGWSTIVHWAGVRLVDFMKKYPPATKSGGPFDPKRLDDLPVYVSMETPDGVYFVGLDMASALHPQTVLCYEMNGKPLTPEHGAPLRLAIPVKYGIKNIKNIGKIKFTDERPKDYWAELGYDWYAGH